MAADMIDTIAGSGAACVLCRGCGLWRRAPILPIFLLKRGYTDHIPQKVTRFNYKSRFSVVHSKLHRTLQ